MGIYKIAKRIVENREKKAQEISKKAKDDWLARMNEYEAFVRMISDMAKTYTEKLEEEYKSKHKPKFKVGQKVLLHPYYKADGWEPNGYSLFHHTPYEGPVEVIIDKIGIDSARVFETIMEYAHHRDYFNRIYSTTQYAYFEKRANDLLMDRLRDYQNVMYYYSFHIPESDHQYWRYHIREDKFLLPNSEEGKAAKEIASLKKKRKDLEKRAKEVQEKYNELCNLIS